jgi:para-nitrobenzyl esterase
MAVVETRQGKVDGEQTNGLFVFRGIPFAAPPTGALRWRAPEAPARWTGVRSATAYGSQSWQPPRLPGTPLAGLMSVSVPCDEDCLTLNVWTPGADARARPVMVWIHGGAFSIGSSAQAIYDGSALARRGDVVVVTINYRLGALGFLRLADVTAGRIPATGNEGLLDQISALQWVQGNIERFGGDPTNVTIFGESAGGMSVGALLGAPRARGLFKRAIPQSGASSTATAAPRASELAEGFIKHLKLKPSDLASLETMDAQALTMAAAGYQLVAGGMPYQPCIEPELLPQLPLESVKAGNADGVSVLVGAAAHEWLLFSAMDPAASSLDDGHLRARISARVGSSADALIGGYRELLTSRGEPHDPLSIFAAIETDRVFRLPGLRLAEALTARGQPAHHYEFTWRSPLLNGKLKSCHAIDLGFVFATHALNCDIAKFCGEGPSANTLANTVQDAWLAFARTGTPRAAGLDRWAPYDSKQPTTGVFDVPASVSSSVLLAERRLWEGQADGTTVGRL